MIHKTRITIFKIAVNTGEDGILKLGLSSELLNRYCNRLGRWNGSVIMP
ncbi:MAG: hypothetical protein ACLUD1_02205 [Clostridia bacterium]